MRVQTIALMAAVAVLTACVPSREYDEEDSTALVCDAKPGKPTITDPNSPKKAAKEKAKLKGGCKKANVFSVIFDTSGKPAGVGGMAIDPNNPNHPKDKNDKLVEANQDYCWIATDENGNLREDRKFAILFSPQDDFKKQDFWAVVKITKDLKPGIEYKYTIWSEYLDEQGNTVCGIMDPRFVIN